MGTRESERVVPYLATGTTLLALASRMGSSCTHYHSTQSTEQRTLYISLILPPLHLTLHLLFHPWRH